LIQSVKSFAQKTPAGSWCAIILILQPILFFWRSVVSQTTHIPWDLAIFHAPLASVVVEGLKAGRIPLWEPYAYAGYPLHADITAQLFYPPAWLAFLFGAVREDAILYWLEWLVVLHLMLAGAGSYLLLRRLACRRGTALFGATAFQLGCFFSSQAQHLGAVCAAAWMPFAWLGVVSLAEGFSIRRFAVLATALSMIFLAGFPAITLVAYASTVMVAAGFAMQRRNPRLLLSVFGAFVVTGFLCAVQLVPTLDLSANSVASRRWEWAEPGGVTPRAIIGAIWPDYLHVFTPFDQSKFTEQANFTFLYFYNGQLAAWFALFAVFVRKGPARIFAIVAAISLFLLCGGHLPGYAWVFRSLPRFVRSATYIEFTIAAYSLSVAVAAALVLEALLGRRDRWAIAIALATGLELLLVASDRPMNSGEGGWKGRDSTRQMMHQPGLLASVRHLVHESEPPYRTDTADRSPRFTSSAPLLRLQSANGDSPFAPLRILAYRALYTKVVPWERQYPIQTFDSPLIGAANVAFVVHDGAPLDDGRMRSAGWIRVPVTNEKLLSVYRNPNVLPRYRLVDDIRPVQDMNAALAVLPGIDQSSSAIVEGALPMLPSGAGPPGRVRVLEYSPEEVELSVDTRRASYLVVAEGYAAGWNASIDSIPVTPFPTNVAFMGIPIPSGMHHVRLFYRPASLIWWGVVSVVTWVLVIVFACAPYRKWPVHFTGRKRAIRAVRSGRETSGPIAPAGTADRS
jgi:hypothetical protein